MVVLCRPNRCTVTLTSRHKYNCYKDTDVFIFISSTIYYLMLFLTLLDELQTGYNLMTRRVLRRQIWVYTVCSAQSEEIHTVNTHAKYSHPLQIKTYLLASFLPSFLTYLFCFRSITTLEYKVFTYSPPPTPPPTPYSVTEYFYFQDITNS